MHDHEFEHWHGVAELGADAGLDSHVLTTVGVDIGSSTSHVMLSRLTVRRLGSGLSTRFVVSEREVLHASAPALTPYRGGTHIDVNGIDRWLRASYAAAGIEPAEVDTGVVVITGEALTKANSARIAAMVGAWSGDFICVSAGPTHEGFLAAYGSGSVELSRAGHRVLNVDIGGGTTKASLVEDGRISHVEAFSVGARLVATDATGALVRIEEPAHVHARRCGVRLAFGDPLADDAADEIADEMAALVLSAIEPGPPEVEAARRALMVTDPAAPSPQHARLPDHIVFSGGVSEYLYGRDHAEHGDLGARLAAAVRARLVSAGLESRVLVGSEGIRATVLGASQFTVQASGQTSYVTDLDALPMRHLPVVPLRVGAAPSVAALVAELRREVRLREEVVAEGSYAVSLRWSGLRDYADLRAVAEALVAVAGDGVLVVVQEPDLAHVLGRVVATELGFAAPLVVLDGIDVGELDFLDIGRPMGATGSFPVTVKSLSVPITQLDPARTA